VTVKVPLSFLFALALHITLGWAWTLLAGVLAGAWVVRRGWIAGAVSVGLDWLVLVVYNFAVAGREVASMVEILGGILGNLPGAVIVATTLLIGVLLGGLGGIIGSHVVLAFKTSRIRASV